MCYCFAVDGEWEYRRVLEKRLASRSVETGMYCVPFRAFLHSVFPQLEDAACGLQYLHSLDLAHGDLKGVWFPNLSSGNGTYLDVEKYPHLRQRSRLSRRFRTHEVH